MIQNSVDTLTDVTDNLSQIKPSYLICELKRF